jgi:hypothetical protein
MIINTLKLFFVPTYLHHSKLLLKLKKIQSNRSPRFTPELAEINLQINFK